MSAVGEADVTAYVRGQRRPPLTYSHQASAEHFEGAESAGDLSLGTKGMHRAIKQLSHGKEHCAGGG